MGLSFIGLAPLSYCWGDTTSVVEPALARLYSSHARTSDEPNFFLSISNSQACDRLRNSIFLVGDIQWYWFCLFSATSSWVHPSPGGGFILGVFLFRNRCFFLFLATPQSTTFLDFLFFVPSASMQLSSTGQSSSSYWPGRTTAPLLALSLLYSCHARFSVPNVCLSFSNSQAATRLLNSIFLVGDIQWPRFWLSPAFDTSLYFHPGPGGVVLLGVVHFLFGVIAGLFFDSISIPPMSYWFAEMTYVPKPTLIFLYSSQAWTSLPNFCRSSSNSQASGHLRNSMFLTGDNQWHCLWPPATSTTNLYFHPSPGGRFLVEGIAWGEVESLSYLLGEITYVSEPFFILLYSSHARTSLPNSCRSVSNSHAAPHLLNWIFLVGDIQWQRCILSVSATLLCFHSGPGGGFLVCVILIGLASYWLGEITYVSEPCFILLNSSHACTSSSSNVRLSCSNSQASGRFRNAMFLMGEIQWFAFRPYSDIRLCLHPGPGGVFLLCVLILVGGIRWFLLLATPQFSSFLGFLFMVACWVGAGSGTHSGAA